MSQPTANPPLCPLADYLELMQTLGIARMVQVNASTYGYDNTLTLDVIERLHKGGMRGVRKRIFVTNPARLYGFD